MSIRRKIIRIDQEKCDGCGLCVEACHEGAIQLINGKAQLVSETYCDGLGDCIGQCPCGAITIEEREAKDYDAEAVKRHLTNGAPHPPSKADAAVSAPRPQPRGAPAWRPSSLPPAMATRSRPTRASRPR